MKGIIEFRNPLSGRYAVRTESGRYTTFRLLAGGVVLEAGEDVSGELEGRALQTLRSEKHGYMNVFVEKARLARSAAQSWVIERSRAGD
jgi:hypothetical protein